MIFEDLTEMDPEDPLYEWTLERLWEEDPRRTLAFRRRRLGSHS
jgi:hypothetical protein